MDSISRSVVFAMLVGTLLPFAAARVAAQGATDVLIEEVLVTARKRARAEELQSVPVAVTAYNDQQLKALGFNSLLDISFSIPNVSLDEIGTGRGVASFSIRGLSATSSIPSIDPAVATFIDGIYLPTNAGTVLDMFDVETIEVLRGPQGTLFGRNVTGGAVLVRSKRPSQEFSTEALVRYEDGGEEPTYTTGIAVQGGLTESLSARLSMYYRDDGGYFENRANEADPTLNVKDTVGDNYNWFIRPSILWEPTDTFSIWAKYEHMEAEGEQPPPQNQSNFFGRKDDGLSYNFVNEGSYEVDFLTVEMNWDIGPGTLTNLTGWREQDSTGGNDIDATRFERFSSGGFTQSDMWSNELRYAGTTENGKLDFTVGVFYYEADLEYVEQRNVFGGVVFAEGGGKQETESIAVFTENEFYFTDQLSAVFGIRYSKEEKDAAFTEIAGPACDGPDSFPLSYLPTCDRSSFDDDEWETVGGKLGINYRLNDDALLYAHFTRGFRSGGFNMRDTVADGTNQESYDEEEMDVLEIGIKADWLDGRLRTNAAIFHNWAEDLQRDVNTANPNAPGGVQQNTANTADGDIFGIEFEGTWLITENLLLTAGFGHLDFEYTEVLFDLNGDGIVDDADKDQEFPRLAEWTAHASITWDVPLDFGYLSTRVSYDYRDDVFFTDSNTTPILGPDMLSARIALNWGDGRYEVAAFGRNLLDHTVASGSSEIAASVSAPDPFFGVSSLGEDLDPAGTFSPINPGRIIGLEFSVEL